jgi:hypothetical protein
MKSHKQERGENERNRRRREREGDVETGRIRTYSKSVSSLREVRGWKIRDRLFMPSTQAESGVLAKIRPGDTKRAGINIGGQ